MLDDVNGFYVEAYQEGNPSRHGFAVIDMPAGKTWRFVSERWAIGTSEDMFLDDYKEFTYNTTNYKYNTGTGELVKITDAKGNVTTFTYDMLGRKTAMSHPDMGVWSYTYDKNGNLITQTDAKGQVLWFKYDDLNRVLEKRQTNSSGMLLASYLYDDTVVGGPYARGHMVQVDGTTWVTGYSYDAMDRIVNITLPDGEGVNHTYNAQGLPQQMFGTNTYLYSASYNTFGKLTDMRFHDSNGVKTNYDYYDSGDKHDSSAGVYYSYRLKRLWLSDSSGVAMDLNYQYDKVGNVRVLDQPGETFDQSFGYDDLNRLMAAVAFDLYGYQTYAYDAIGNITSMDGNTYSYSGNTHKVTDDGTYTYEYDANGNITSRDWSRMYTYDYDNMLTQVKRDVTIVIENNVYDHAGVRVKKDNGNYLGGITTYYINKYYEEEWTHGSKTNTIKHYFANRQRIATRDNEGLKFNHTDHLGSAGRASNTLEAQVKAIYYDPWGDEAASSGSAAVKYTFTGKERDTDSYATGLFYYGARYYDPLLGRFTTPDSLIPDVYNPQALNPYTYVFNNPLRLIDPDGHVPQAADNRSWGQSVPIHNQTIHFDSYNASAATSVKANALADANYEASMGLNSAARVTAQGEATVDGQYSFQGNVPVPGHGDYSVAGNHDLSGRAGGWGELDAGVQADLAAGHVEGGVRAKAMVGAEGQLCGQLGLQHDGQSLAGAEAGLSGYGGLGGKATAWGSFNATSGEISAEAALGACVKVGGGANLKGTVNVRNIMNLVSPGWGDQVFNQFSLNANESSVYDKSEDEERIKRLYERKKRIQRKTHNNND